MQPRKMRVTREVARDEHHNYYGCDVPEGMVFFTVIGHTYGCIDTNGGIALSELPGLNPFFEFPIDAIEEVA